MQDMMIRRTKRLTRRVVTSAIALLMAGLFASTVVSLPLDSQTPESDAGASAKAGRPTHYRPARLTKRAESYYDFVWGLDSLSVKSVEAGALIRFSYRVIDPAKAKPVNDEKNTPSLIDPKAGVRLVVPSLEKVGKLRQVSAPEAGKMYWMTFSNKRGFVKPGDRVDIAIGNFHANGLVVE
jgi:hypothetical protein